MAPLPRLSVIVPFFDETAFLPLALASVQAQGLQDVQIVVVNDNPDRFGPAALARLIGDVPAEMLAHDTNLGLSAARNTGLAAATGQWIAFLDADDYYMTGGLERHLARAEATGADIVHAATCLALGGSPALSLLPRDRALHMQPRDVAGGLIALPEAQVFVSSWSSLYRADFLRGAGLAFDPKQTRFEDRLFVLQSVTAARRIATLGAPVRVWRRRAGSISTRRSDPQTHVLQLQLLEKCMAHFTTGPGKDLPARFRKRETFVTLGRLIWDLDLLDAVIRGESDHAGRIAALLGPEGLDNSFFSDTVIRRISRLGQASRRGVISRTTFFRLHAALRNADIDSLRQLLPPLSTVPRREPALPATRPAAPQGRQLDQIILHVGMHKTGTTWLQGQLRHHRAGLARERVIVPLTGEDRTDRRTTRPGAWAGHAGLAQALRSRSTAIWDELAQEIRSSLARRAVISCENLLFPFDPDRPRLIADLVERLSAFGPVRTVAMVRSPHRQVENLWREMAGNGRRLGARSAAEFAKDHGERLTDLPTLFGPFETATGAPMRLADFDDRRQPLWPGFLALCGLEPGLADRLPPSPDISTYPTLPAEVIAAARLVNAMIPDEDQRIEVLRALVRLSRPEGTHRSFLAPDQRLALVESYTLLSADWAAPRGYAPCIQHWRDELAAEDWTEPPAPDAALVERLLAARIMAEVPAQDNSGTSSGLAEPSVDSPLVIRIAPRPWLARLLQRAGIGSHRRSVDGKGRE